MPSTKAPIQANGIIESLDGGILHPAYSWTAMPSNAASTAGTVTAVSTPMYGLAIDNGTSWLHLAGENANAAHWASLGTAIASLGATSISLMIPHKMSVSSNITVPNTVTLIFTGTGEISADAGQTVTINGPILAPPGRRIFGGSGSVVFGTVYAPYPISWFGALGDGSTNDSTTIQNAINALPTTGGTILVPATPNYYRLTSQLSFATRSRVRFIGEGGTGELDSVKFVWDGANGGVPFLVNQIRDSEFSNFSIVPGTGTILAGLEIDQIAPVTVTSTNNKFSKIHIGASTHGVRISNAATSNNDLHIFEDVYITGAGTNGYLINHSQAKFIKIIRGSVANRTNGINCTSGSFYSESGNFNANTADIYLGTPTDSILIVSPQSETSDKFIDDSGAAGNAWNVTVVGGRVDPNSVGVDNIYVQYRKRGALNLIGVDFASGVNYPNTRFNFNSSSPGATVNIIGCVFPNGTPYSVGTTRRIVSQGNMYIAADGSGQIIEHHVEGNVGINTTSPTNLLSLGGNSARTIWMERHTTADTAGNNLTAQAGGATSGATDKAPGSLILATGLGTGNATPGLVRLQGTDRSATSGTGDRSLIDRFIPNASKVLTNNSAIAVVNATIASNTSVGGKIVYTIEVFDGTDVQVETGEVFFGSYNKAGVVSGTATEVNSQQNLSAGTLATTWAISNANPAVISINANSSLTPSTGYPRITFSITNLGQQAIGIQ